MTFGSTPSITRTSVSSPTSRPTAINSSVTRSGSDRAARDRVPPLIHGEAECTQRAVMAGTRLDQPRYVDSVWDRARFAGGRGEGRDAQSSHGGGATADDRGHGGAHPRPGPLAAALGHRPGHVDHPRCAAGIGLEDPSELALQLIGHGVSPTVEWSGAWSAPGRNAASARDAIERTLLGAMPIASAIAASSRSA